MRTTILMFFISVIIGVAFGFFGAVSMFAVNHWDVSLEFNRNDFVDKPVAIKNTTDSKVKVYIENKVYDFGVKDVKEKGTHDFEIKNVGSGILTLRVDRTTCTCTGIDLNRQRLAAGETAIATVRYDAERATTGRYEQGGIIVTNDPQTPEIPLSIRGIFTSPVVVSSPVILLPSVSATEKQTAKVRIYGFEKEPLKLEPPVWTDKTHFDLKFEQSELNDDDKNNSLFKHAISVCEGTLTITPFGMPVGTFQERFNIKTSYVSESSIEIFARGQIYGAGITLAGQGFDRTTGIMSIETIRSGEKIVRDISIQFTGTNLQNAEIKVKEVRPKWLKTNVTKGGVETAVRRFFTLSIEIPPDAPQCNYTTPDDDKAALVILETGMTNSPTIKIPIRFAIEK
ncbi:MAG: DUF1573 domain-containing protein [Planctomycetaceae bacterium]|jgi:hypothetical protein|nr:DUF1573 domain-containing protein [Planctomycetaceae bacterium]